MVVCQMPHFLMFTAEMRYCWTSRAGHGRRLWIRISGMLKCGILLYFWGAMFLFWYMYYVYVRVYIYTYMYMCHGQNIWYDTWLQFRLGFNNEVTGVRSTMDMVWRYFNISGSQSLQPLSTISNYECTPSTGCSKTWWDFPPVEMDSIPTQMAYEAEISSGEPSKILPLPPVFSQGDGHPSSKKARNLPMGRDSHMMRGMTMPYHIKHIKPI